MKNAGMCGGRRAGGVMVAVLVGALAGACDEPKKAKDVTPVVRDVPTVLRGQIGAEAGIRGTEPVLVSGFGLVVGVNGTGGGPIPGPIEATMERELALGGVGKGGPLDTGPLAGRTPKQVLRDPNVAVVVVEGVIAPGSPKGANFDVRVRALPTNATSLEGGTLWTTQLRLGPPTPFMRMRTRKLAEARGPVYINPFADPSGDGRVVLSSDPAAEAVLAGRQPLGGAGPSEGPAEPREESTEGAVEQPDGGAAPMVPVPSEADANVIPPPLDVPVIVSDGVTRTIGRVLAGGLVTDPLLLELVLDNPSHARAASIQQAINNRFPQAAGMDEGPSARGRNNTSIAVRVPRNYKEKPEEFVTLLRFLQIDQAFPQEYAKRYADALKAQPQLAEELSWSLQAVGRAATPFLSPLYENPEFLPRMAALRAGAKLGDARATPFLIQMARSGPTSLRTEAIEFMGTLGPSPQINMALRELVDAQELEVRVAAYESLELRGDPTIERVNVDDKFMLHVVPARDELIYVTQQGKPRIVLFGGQMALKFPMLASAWADRLILKYEGAQARIYYRDYRSDRVTQGNAPKKVKDLVKFMAHQTTPEYPEPGLDLTYSEVVGALYEIQRQGGVNAAFATERERLLARLLEASDVALVDERPESSDRPVEKPEAIKPVQKAAATPLKPAPRRSLVVPLSPKGGTAAGGAGGAGAKKPADSPGAE